MRFRANTFNLKNGFMDKILFSATEINPLDEIPARPVDGPEGTLPDTNGSPT